jgi:hypothetical protein
MSLSLPIEVVSFKTMQEMILGLYFIRNFILSQFLFLTSRFKFDDKISIKNNVYQSTRGSALFIIIFLLLISVLMISETSGKYFHRMSACNDLLDSDHMNRL